VKPVGLRGVRRYGRMAAAMIVIVLSVAGCGLDSSPPDGPTVPDGAIDVPPPAIPNADPAAVAWLDRLMADAQQGGSADTSILTQAQYGQLVTSLPPLACCIQSVAQQLNSINPARRVAPAGIQQFLTDWCYLDIRTAVGRMFATIPGADVRTLPVLNQLLSLF